MERHRALRPGAPRESPALCRRDGFKAGLGRPRIRLVLPSPAPTGRTRPRWPGARPVRPSGAWFGVWALLPHFRGRFQVVKNTNQALQSYSVGLFRHDQFWPAKAADLPKWRTTR